MKKVKKNIFKFFLLGISLTLIACNHQTKESVTFEKKEEMEIGNEEIKNDQTIVIPKEKDRNWMEGLPKEIIIDAPHIKQLPELSRGCEVTSLAMLLQFANVKVDKMTLAHKVFKDTTPYQEINGEIYFGNPHKGFVGDIYSFENKGYAVYHEPIFELGKRYLPNNLKNISGESFRSVYESLAQGKPVWVITTSTFDIIQADQWVKWNTPDGEIYVTLKEHSVLITGYDEQYIYINDPLGMKNQKVEKESFIIGWEQLGFQAITLK